MQLTQKHIAAARKRLNGTLLLDDLTFVKRDQHNHYYVCPCGGTDHYAMRMIAPKVVAAPNKVALDNGWPAKAPILNCYQTDKFWIIDDNVVNVINREEKKFNALLDKWVPLLPTEMTAAQAFDYHTSKGVPFELVEILVTDKFGLDSLMREHREKSHNSKLGGAIFK